jgi:hypothetical protein
MHANAFNGRLDFQALQEHFEGVGINSVDIVNADKALETLFYSGEKKPHMWWEEFEMQLTTCFTIYDRKEARIVHLNDMKLRILIRKLNADFLVQIKAAISIEMTRIPVTLTYEQALSSFRNEVNRKFPPEMSNNKTRRHINAVDRGGRDAGRGRGGRFNGRGGRSGGGRSNGGRGRGQKRARTDSNIITLTDGKVIESHPSFNFTPEQWERMQPQDKYSLIRKRQEYKRSRQGGQQQSTPREIQYVQVLPAQAQQDQASVGQVSQLSIGQVTQNPPSIPNQGGTIMGGRNEQQGNRQRGPGE